MAALYFSLVFILGMARIRPALGIDCFLCSSTLSDCGQDPNQASLIRLGFVESGCKSCTKSFSALGTIWWSVIRGCDKSTASDSCSNVIGYGQCSCTTTFCNGGNRISASGLKMLTSLALYFFLNVL